MFHLICYGVFTIHASPRAVTHFRKVFPYYSKRFIRAPVVYREAPLSLADTILVFSCTIDNSLVGRKLIENRQCKCLFNNI